MPKPKEASGNARAGRKKIPELVDACADGDIYHIRRFLMNWADPDYMDSNGCTPLTETISMGGGNCLETVVILLRYGANINMTDSERMTPLMIAASHRRTLAVLEALLTAGADTDARNQRGETALMLALRIKDNQSTVTALLQAGADVSIQNRFGFTARDYALQRDYRQEAFDDNRLRIKILKQVHGNDLSWIRQSAVISQDRNLLSLALVDSAIRDYTEMAALLLEMGAPVNGTSLDGTTPLIAAACRANVDMVQLLLDHGADVFQKDGEGKTALQKMRRWLPNDGGGIISYHGGWGRKELGAKRLKEIRAAQRQVVHLLLNYRSDLDESGRK